MTPEIEISQATLNSLPNCLLVDMRDAESVAYGVIPGAVPLPPERLEAEVPARCAGRPVVLYCARGQFSVDAAEDLRRLGVEAYSLEDGYAGWLLYRMQREQETSLQQQIEEGIRKTWHKRLFSKFAKAIRTYDLVKPGDRIVVGDNIYGGSYSQLNEFFTRWGIIVEAVDTQDIAALEAAVKGDRANGIVPAQAVYFETLTNPLLKVNDVRAISTVAHRFGALSIVDNTFVTPYLQKPLALGADVVIHSATKYLAGHSDVNAGLVVVSGEDLASRVYFAQNRLGGVLAPNECDSVRRGIQTLALRMDRQQENARAISSYLLLHPLVKSVHYPGLPGHEYELASNGLKGGGAVLSFEVVPGVDPADVLDNLHIFRLAVSLGAVESLAELPCRMTHFELPREERLKVGITDELVRLAVGIEDKQDLIEDLGQAFDIAYEHYLNRHTGESLFTFAQHVYA